MTALSTRDALAKALHFQYESSDEWPCTDECVERYADDADALLASGAVIDAAILADDETLMQAWARAEYGDLMGEQALAAGANLLRGPARTLAAALTERGAQ